MVPQAGSRMGPMDARSSPVQLSWRSGGFIGLTADEQDLRQHVWDLQCGGELEDHEWTQLLTRTPIFRARTRWPAGVPYEVSMRSPSWLSGNSIKLAADVPGWEAAVAGTPDGVCGTFAAWQVMAANRQVLGPLEESRTVVFSVSIDQDDGRNSSHDRAWEGRLEGRIEVVPTVDDAVPPIDSPALSVGVRRSIGLVAGKPFGPEGEQRHLWLHFDVDQRAHPELRTVGLSFEVDLMHAGQVVESEHIYVAFDDHNMNRNSVYGGLRPIFARTTFEDLPVEVLEDPAQWDGWSLRARGTNLGVLQLTHAPARWSGTVTLPVAEAFETERARTEDNPRGAVYWSPRPSSR